MIQQLKADSTFFHAVFRVSLHMKPTLADVLAALTDIVEAHESLRTVFEGDPVGLIQHVRQSGSFMVDIAEVAPGQDPREVFQEWEALALGSEFSYEADIPIRAMVALDANVPVFAAVCVSHLAADAMSLRALSSQLVARLGGSAVPRDTRQPIEHAAFERSAEGQRVLARSLAYQRRQLADAPPPVLPYVRTGPRTTLAMDSPAAALAVSTLASQYNVSSGAVLFAAFARVLGQRSGLPRVGMRIASANRFAVDLRNAIANLHQVVPATFDADRPSFAELARSALRSTMAAYSRSHFDPVPVTKLIVEHDAKEWFPVVVSDIRKSRGVLAADGESRRPSLDDTQITPHWFRVTIPFYLLIDNDEFGWLRIVLSANDGVIPPADTRQFLLAVEQLLVQEASAADLQLGRA